MDKDIDIKVENVSKLYKLYDKPIDRLKEAINPFRKKYHKAFYALKDVSFNIRKGEAVGIIGQNGSGKSTLLQIITGVLSHTSGNLAVNGKISALLELGTGFNPELTGIENIYFYGAIMGVNKGEMDKRIDEIISFADIGEFVHQPVKVYSSGMFVKLAFSVAINVQPDILIVDEALAVGDIRFQQKCYRKIKEIKTDKTILFVSHDLGAVTNFCDRVIWLNDGEIIEDDTPAKVIKNYYTYMVYNSENDIIDSEMAIDENHSLMDIDPLPEGVASFGEGAAKIIGASLFKHKLQSKIKVLEGGEKVDLVARIKLNDYIDSPIIGFTMKNKIGFTILSTNTAVLRRNIEPLQKGDTLIVRFSFMFPNIKNDYYIFSLAIANGTLHNHIQHHWVHDVIIVEVRRNDQFAECHGLCVFDDIDIEVS